MKKNEEERSALVQGTNLAKRVDALRTASTDEEKRLQDIRGEMTASIKAEITTLNDQLMGIKGEISQLEINRTELMKPLTAERAVLEKDKSEFTDRVVELENQKSEVLSMKLELQRKVDMVDDSIERANERFKKADALYQQKVLQQKEINRMINKLNGDMDTFNKERDRVSANLSNRETRVAIREKELQLKIDDFKKKQHESKLYLSRPKQ